MGANSCDDCTAVVNVLAMGLVSDASIANQQAILVGGLCPTSENPAECEAGLPDFWKAIALALWPGYYDPPAEWMCGPICAAPRTLTWPATIVLLVSRPPSTSCSPLK